MILCSDPHAQFLLLKDDVDRALQRVLDSGWYILGEEVCGFEKEFAEYIGVEHAVGVGSGTDGDPSRFGGLRHRARR